MGTRTSRTLPYGTGGVVHIETPADAVVADLTFPPGCPIADPAAAVQRALAKPLEYPPLDQATVRGDRVALAVDRGVPQVAEVVAGVVRALVAGPVLPEDITVVLAQGEGQPRQCAPTSRLDAALAEAIPVVHHDPSDLQSLAYLAASRDNRPIYINRHLFDADVVLPVGCVLPDGALGYLGVHGCFFPTFSDEATQRRFRSPRAAESEVHRRRHRQEADEAAWLLGIQMVVQVVPGAGDTIFHVLAGQPSAVADQGQCLCEGAWLRQVPQRASLVIVSIEGGQEAQTWDNFARALSTALEAVADDGVIVVCTDLRCRPGPALRRLASLDDDAAVLRAIYREREPDAVPASLLVEARSRSQVYLMSGLDEETVEELGVGYVRGEEELRRLARQHDSCILLANAHRAVVTPPLE